MKLLLNLFKIIIVWFFVIVILILINNRYSKPKVGTKVVSTRNLVDNIFASFSVEEITPDTFCESWVDNDGDGIFNPLIDDFLDDNNNNKFDAIYLAGLNKGRAVKFIKDKLYLVVFLILADQNFCIINYDGFGLSDQDIYRIKKNIKKRFNIENILFLPNRNYNMPDLLGYWGILNKGGINKSYFQFFEFKIYEGIKNALEEPKRFKLYEKKDKSRALLAYKLEFDNEDSLFILFTPKQFQRIYNNYIATDYYNDIRLYLGNNVIFINYNKHNRNVDRRSIYSFIVDLKYDLGKVDTIDIHLINEDFYLSIFDFDYLLDFYSRKVKRDVYFFTDLKSNLQFFCFNNNKIFLLNTEYFPLIDKKFVNLLGDRGRIFFVELSTDYLIRKDDDLFQKIVLKKLWDIEENFEVDLIQELESQ